MTLVLTTRFHSPLPDHQWNEYLGKLPEFIQEEILRYRRWQDRHCVLCGKLLLREGLKYYRFDPKALSRLGKDEYGRPSIPGFHDFSISHSAQHAVCAFHPRAKIGVDIEHIRPIDFTHFQSYMTDNEWHEIHNATPSEPVFFRYWAIKESVIKADGRGLSAPLDEVDIQGDIAYLQGEKWYLKELNLYFDMASCLACDVPIDDVEIRTIQFG